ncbi:hypothetical protein TSUD_13710 [Trifolium subterraneum]|uniref:C2H2-type domain-containing protein n=1 Tax=Trifolium subterraneum TaxID=3900 RepID=A0A2Z6PAZ4_TRISU|nr:hypothetical protein TSUD_13710 [Trifolium subterraneum]
MTNGFSNNRHDMLNSVACRLCNRVFISGQALITHIESHMEHEEAAIRRLYPQAQFPSHYFRPGFHVPIDTQYINGGRIFHPQPRRNQFCNVGSMQMQLPPHVLPNPHVYQWKHLEEESSNDGTKAYIMQLEKPIKKIDFIDLVSNDDDMSNDVHTLDLALKL